MSRTGSDYYIAPAGYDQNDLEHYFRLEVSGTDANKSKVKQRLRTKMGQAQRGNSNLPALAVVASFKVQLILIQTVDKQSKSLKTNEKSIQDPPGTGFEDEVQFHVSP